MDRTAALTAPAPAGPQRSPDPDLISIGDLARLTGVTVATLRVWESRHGFPQAHRLESGHRRYDQQHVEQVQAVLRRRDAGMRLDMAIAEALADDGPKTGSVFADLRSAHPQLHPHVLKKSTLIALSHAFEDECCARAERPYLFGAFQKADFYRLSQRRWRNLARTSKAAYVFAEFTGSAGSMSPAEVVVAPSSPLAREWSLVCLADDYPVCLSAWELPSQSDLPDRDRLFEAVWTLDPGIVRDAARSFSRELEARGHDVTALNSELESPLTARHMNLQAATAMFNRVVAYVDRMTA